MQRAHKRRKKDFEDYFNEFMEWFLFLAPLCIAWTAICAGWFS